MRLVATHRATIGSELGRDVLVGKTAPLLRTGVRITERMRNQLIDHGVAAIYVEDAESEGIIVEPVIDDATREIATKAIADAYSSAKNSFAKGKPLSPEAVSALEEIVRRIHDQIDSAAGVALALADLATADAYTFQHSISVTAAGLLIGQRYFRDYGWVDYMGTRHHSQIDERLTSLGLGLLLHDIGKLVVPDSILNKPEKLTPKEWELMKTHPRAGVDLLAGSSWNPLVKAVVLRHHERWDGTGYPDGKKEEEIHQMARIAAVADVFDAVTSDRVYARARPQNVGVRIVREGRDTLFDRDVVDTFLAIVAPFPPGSPIELIDGRSGVVVSCPDGALDRPVVRILSGDSDPYEIALLDDPELLIVGWEDAHVPTTTG